MREFKSDLAKSFYETFMTWEDAVNLTPLGLFDKCMKKNLPINQCVINYVSNSREDGQGAGVVGNGNLLPYLDEKHQHYSEELSAAISAWLHFENRSNIKSQKGYKAQIIEWLNGQYPKISDTAKNRIATIVNHDKNGGQPKATT